MPRQKTIHCPFCGGERVKDGSHHYSATCGSEECLKKFEKARKLQRRIWGSANVHPNSLAAGFDKEKRQEFQAWLKVIDKDQSAVERGLRGMM